MAAVDCRRKVCLEAARWSMTFPRGKLYLQIPGGSGKGTAKEQSPSPIQSAA